LILKGEFKKSSVSMGDNSESVVCFIVEINTHLLYWKIQLLDFLVLWCL